MGNLAGLGHGWQLGDGQPLVGDHLGGAIRDSGRALGTVLRHLGNMINQIQEHAQRENEG